MFGFCQVLLAVLLPPVTETTKILQHNFIERVIQKSFLWSPSSLFELLWRYSLERDHSVKYICSCTLTQTLVLNAWKTTFSMKEKLFGWILFPKKKKNQ